MEEKYTPVLTLNPMSEPAPEAPAVSVSPAVVAEKSMVESANLTPEEMKLVDDFSKQIDITDSVQVMQYGAAVQQKMSEFSEGALANVRTKDLGATGDMIVSLIAELKGFDAAGDDKGLLGFLRKKGGKIEALKNKYDKAEVNVDRIAGMLEQHQVTLLKDVSMLDNMYERNLAYFKELTMYILAGKKKLELERSTTLPELLAKAEKSGLPEDAQKARDFSDMCTRFEKKIYDLELTRNISIQMAPQIRLIQNNDTMMAEKIQTSLVNTIPLWKSQMVLTLGLMHSQQAIEAQSAVTDRTNKLLKKNAETLHTATVSAAKESERGIVDIETLTETNNKLIETMDDVLRIQKEGHEKRVAAEAELTRIENELKKKLVEVSGVKPKA
ncbi:MAG: toxic anion resistance protein [Christensenellaceae bacterium]|nr:toxic anion resistance protein [Christensenellaceae bacterium]